MPQFLVEHLLDLKKKVALENLLFVGTQQLEDQTNLRREGDSDMLAIEEGNSISKKGLKLNPEVAVIPVVNLAFDLGIWLMLSL